MNTTGAGAFSLGAAPAGQGDLSTSTPAPSTASVAV